jgi:cellulose synthase operon protein C
MGSWVRPIVLGLLLAAAIPASAVLAAEDAEQILLDKANYWRLKDRPDLAIEALTKLLFLDPNQPDGLYQLGMLDVQQGKTADARTALARLQKAAPDSPHIAELQNAIRAGKVGPNELSEARKLAQSGQLTEAIQKYQQTFHGPPPPSFGVEYYTTLAGTPGGWEQAKDGLAQLAQSSPNDKSIRLALAQVLINRETSRADGIAMLVKLSKDPAVGADAVKSWRQALLWGATREYYGEYLAQFPNDQEVRQRANDIASQGGGAQGQTQSQGYVDLQHGKTALADKEFTADLKSNPNDAQALGGLGLVRLREERFADARDLLGRAMKADPTNEKQWTQAYESATFWGTVQQAKSLQAAGRLPRAKSLLTGLLAHPHANAAGAEMVLASVDEKLKDYAGAEAAYRRVLAAQPRNGDALMGLAGVLRAAGKTAEADQIAARLTPAERAKLAAGGGGGSQGEALRKAAKDAEANGNNDVAQQRFKEAIAADPKDPWIRLDYARFLAGQGHVDQGFAVVDPAQTGNTSTSVLVAAMYDVQQDHWADALDKIDRVPAAERSKDLSNFRDRILSRASEDRAKRLASQGNKAEAVRILTALYTSPNVQPDERRVAVYDLYRMGEHQAAIQLAAAQMAKGGPDGAKAGIDYAKLLVTDGQYQRAGTVVDQVEASGQLSGDDRDDLLSVKALLVARDVDKLIDLHHLARAYDEMAPLYAARPNDPTVLVSIGRIYAAGGRDTEALQYFDKAYQQDPGNIDVIRAVVMGAIQAQDYDQAETYLSKGADANPNNPWIFYLKGQLAHARGNDGEALDDLRTAQRMAKEQGMTAPSEAAPSNTTEPALPPNPFRNSENSGPTMRRLNGAG